MKKRISLSFLFLIAGTITYYIFDINLVSKNNYFISNIRNYFPDLCWTMSFFFLSIIFTNNIAKNSMLVNSLYVLVISLLYEFLQLIKLAHGTFDIIDIFIYVISIIFAYLIENIIRRKEYEEII